MKKNLKIFFLIIFAVYIGIFNTVFADTISGNIKEDVSREYRKQVVDSKTGKGINRARINLPLENYDTFTDGNGYFDLDTQINKKTILSVEKQGYRPFSITIDKNIASEPIKLGIEQIKQNDVILESSLIHLGDNLFSDTSANSYEFRGKSQGHFWTKKVSISKPKQGEVATLIIGSVIGLDTQMAKTLGQNKISSVYSSPAEIYFNGKKIGELTINGDNQEIEIPTSLISNSNELTIRTGKNLFQREYADYDDMEFMNLRVEYKEKSLWANY